MRIETGSAETKRYARCINASKRISWDIDDDVIRGREFDFSQKFLPDGLSLVHELRFLSNADRRLLSQVQGRSYANIFGLVERFITAKILEISRFHLFGDQVALDALIGFTDEELKHQELFRRIERMIGAGMPRGYAFVPQPNDVASVVLEKSTWAVLGLTCHIELFTQSHYKESIEPDENLSDLFKDVFLFHWKEESQHAILDELEWRREHRSLSPEQRDRAVDDLIELVAAVDGILQSQSVADAEYFCSICETRIAEPERQAIEDQVSKAYRWQFIVSGVQNPRFRQILAELTTDAQRQRIENALAPLLESA